MADSSESLSLAKTLREWRSSGWAPDGTVPRDVWIPLEGFFRNEGFMLWRKGELTMTITVPPNALPRKPDPFAYTTRYQKESDVPYFSVLKAIHCPARTDDQQDVLIRLVAKSDQGLNHLEALHRLAIAPIAYHSENHVVPVLREIIRDDMTFIVFPLMHTGFRHPWYYDFGEVIDAVTQVLEGITFCHNRLVAHLDLDTDNILINFVGGACQDIGAMEQPVAAPFREYFPVRYYINDFEWAVCFDENSDASTRRVSGLPIPDIPREKYGRVPAPEMLTEDSYCPFKTDVWQLGRMLDEWFGHLSELSAPLTELFTEMMGDDPNSRPTAAQAHDRVRQLSSSFSLQLLKTRVVRPRPQQKLPEELPN